MRRTWSIYVCSFIFALTQILGYMIYDDCSLQDDLAQYGIWLLLWLVLGTIGLSIITLALFNVIYWIDMKRRTGTSMLSGKLDKWIGLLLWGIIVCCWIPALLAYWPGIYGYDMDIQTTYAMLGFPYYTKIQPVIHTYLWAWCIRFGSWLHIEAVLIYSVLQLLFFSGCCAGMLAVLYRVRIKKWIWIVSVCFITLNPVLAILSIVTTKDICFSGLMILLVVQGVLAAKNPAIIRSWRWAVPTVGLVVLCCLFRNNTIYAIAAILMLMIIERESCKRYLVATGFVAIVLFLIIDKVIYPQLGIGEGNPREALSVPIQQVCHVAVNESLSNSELEQLDAFFLFPMSEVEQHYNMRLADTTKSYFNSEYYVSHKSEFWDLYKKLFLQYPEEFVCEFLNLNIPYWYCGASTVDPISTREFIETQMIDAEFYSVERESKSVWLLEQYEKVASFKAFAHIVIIRGLHSLWLPIWSLLLTYCWINYRGIRQYRFVILCLFMLWATYIAGPVSLFRYVLPIYLLYPFLLSLLLSSKEFTRS